MKDCIALCSLGQAHPKEPVKSPALCGKNDKLTMSGSRPAASPLLQLYNDSLTTLSDRVTAVDLVVRFW